MTEDVIIKQLTLLQLATTACMMQIIYALHSDKGCICKFIAIDKNYPLVSDKMIVTLAQHTSFMKVRNCNGCYTDMELNYMTLCNG
jgi:hypothetical protein